MGIIVSYEIISEENILKEIEKNMNTAIDIESILNQYPHYIQSFTSFVKTWDPLYMLLYKISGNNIFNKLRENKQSEKINQYTKIFDYEEVKLLYKELQEISIDTLNNKLNDEFLKAEISEESGYHMEYIYDSDCIVIEFNELKNAVSKAYILNSKLIQILFP